MLTSLTTTATLVVVAVVVVVLVALALAVVAVRRAVTADETSARGLSLVGAGAALAVAAVGGWALVGAAAEAPPAPILAAVSRLHPQFDPVLEPDEPPAGFPPMELTSSPGHQPGTLLVSSYTTPRRELGQAFHPAFIAELDKQDGSIVAAQRQYAGTTMFQPEGDGYSYNVADREGVDGAGIEVTHYLTDADLNVLESFDLDDLEGGDADLHDFELLDNGNAMLLAYRKRQVDMTAFGGVADALVWDTVIAERTPDGETVWLWDGAEHMDLADVPAAVAEQRFAAEPPSVIDYAHPNSLEIFDDGDVLVSIRHYDCLLRIDRETGEIVWTFGGDNCADNDFTMTGDDPLGGISHQHDATILDDGNLLVFDNGNLREDPVSRVLEYDLDDDAMTAELVWSYDDGRYTPIMGSAERLANGNTLIGWGQLVDPVVSEVTPDGEVVLEVTTAPGQLVYRAYEGADE